MLGTAFDKIQSLFSPEFLLSGFFPWLTFALANGLMIEFIWPGHALLTSAYAALKPGGQAVAGVAVLVGVAMVAYVSSTLNRPLRILLEGSLPEFIANPMRHTQSEQRRNADAEIRRIQILKSNLDRAAEEHVKQLKKARGNRSRPGETASNGNAAEGGETPELTLKNAFNAIDELRGEKNVARAAESSLPDAVRKTLHAMKFTNTESDVDEVQQAMSDAIKFMQDRVDKVYVQRYTERETRFPRDDIAPTAMGNLAEAVRSYAMSRYNLSLDFFWSRLQTIAQTNPGFIRTVANAKTRLDAIILLLYLTAAFVAFWTVALFFVAPSPAVFLAVGILGPGLVYLLHRFALQGQWIFGEAQRTVIDLYRLDLLRALHLPVPATTDEEKTLWGDLRNFAAYGEITSVTLDPDSFKK